MLDCLDSMAPKDEELLRLALENEPLPGEAREHLGQCSICQQRLARYQHAETFLVAKLYRSQCPTGTQLNFYCADILSTDEKVDIARHLEECPLCAEEVKDIRRFLADFDPFPQSAPSFSSRAALQTIIAALVPWRPQLVTRGQVAGAGARGVEEMPWPRQYRAASINISLHLSRTSSGEIMLLGLFTSDDPDESLEQFEGVSVDLCPTSGAGAVNHAPTDDSGRPLMSGRVDDLGNIAFKGVPVGEYSMIVHLPDSELVIEDLNIEQN